MSDIDGIALEVVKAIGNIDPDKLPGGRTQAIAQAQILVRDAIEKQLEQAEARLAELESAATQKRIDSLNSAFILRKQAEAVESFLSQQAPLLDRYRPQPINEEDHCCEFNLLRDRERLHSEAQRLRQQADEAERAGGEK